MADMKDYTTEELKRLTKLTFETMWQGEYVNVGVVLLRTDKGVVSAGGNTYAIKNGMMNDPESNRRVRSFTDLTEIDPPQAAMLAELERRKLAATFKAGDRVRYRWEANPDYAYPVDRVSSRSVWIGGIEADPIDLTPLPVLRFKKGDVVVRTVLYDVGHLATVSEDCMMSDHYVHGMVDPRIKMESGNDNNALPWDVHNCRLATPADIAAFEARVKAQEDAKRPNPALQVGDVVALLGSRNIVASIVDLPGCSFAFKDAYRVKFSGGGFGFSLRRELRPATDAEVAAYHKAHCAPKTAPEPVVVSNAAHAGRLVRSKRTGEIARVLNAFHARLYDKWWSQTHDDSSVHVWAMQDSGAVTGHMAYEWELL